MDTIIINESGMDTIIINESGMDNVYNIYFTTYTIHKQDPFFVSYYSIKMRKIF